MLDYRRESFSPTRESYHSFCLAATKKIDYVEEQKNDDDCRATTATGFSHFSDSNLVKNPFCYRWHATDKQKNIKLNDDRKELVHGCLSS